MGKQENIGSFYEEAKEIAKAEKSIGAERWVKVSIERNVRGDFQNCIVTHTYDLPVDMVKRWEWVIRWRRARTQCQFPRDIITQSCFYYKKVLGVTINMQHDLDRFISAKAQVTKQRNILNAYIEQRRKENDLFYDENRDEQLMKVKKKLALKEKNVAEAEKRLMLKVAEAKRKNCSSVNEEGK